jgi:hypothetical protein
MRVVGSPWTHPPLPAVREPLGFEATYTIDEAERIQLGLTSEEMEDKWHIYFEADWLKFHRSWTGVYLYALRFEPSAAGVRVVESWVNRDPEQYRSTDTTYDRKLIGFLIDAFLLKKQDVRFPVPPGAPNQPAGVFQHHLVGRRYPESSDNDA